MPAWTTPLLRLGGSRESGKDKKHCVYKSHGVHLDIHTLLEQQSHQLERASMFRDLHPKTVVVMGRLDQYDVASALGIAAA